MEQAHGEMEAERLLTVGLRVLRATAEQLSELPKGAPEKRVLACCGSEQPLAGGGLVRVWGWETSR